MKLITAAKNSKEDLLQLQVGFEETEVQNSVETELRLASSYGNLDQVKILLEQYGGLLSSDQNGWTPLHFAAKHGHVDVLEYLINHGADVNDVTKDGETAVEMATSSGKMAAVKLLIEEHGATIHDSIELNLINIAANQNQLDIVKYLISRDDDVTIEFDNNETAIQLETRYKIQVISGLIEEIGSRCVTQQYGFKARSISQGLRETRVDDLADMCRTALLLAALAGDLDSVRMLMEKFDAEIVGNDEGWTPLHFAARGGHVDVVDYLISNGADLEAGIDAMQIAALHERREVVELLRRRATRRLSPWIGVAGAITACGMMYLIYDFFLIERIQF